MKLFRQAQLHSASKKIYNYCISRARHVVENSFGILASRFRIFHIQINLEPENIKKFYHFFFFLIEQHPTFYAHPNSISQENYDGSTSIVGLDTSEPNTIALQRMNPGNITTAVLNSLEISSLPTL